MTSSRYSKVTTLALLVVVAFAVVAPVAAVEYDEESLEIPAEAEAGTQVSASVLLTDPYTEPNWDPWTLKGSTELDPVTWQITFIDQTGSEFDTRTFDGQQLNDGDGVEISTERNIDQVRVEVTGRVPRPEEFTYPEKETFTVLTLTQTRGQEGAREEIETWETHHYTTGGEDEVGSRRARRAIASAEEAIANATAVGADTSEANQSLENAITFYESEDFGNAVKNANDAKSEAQAAREAALAARETNQLLLYGAIVVLLLGLVGGGYWYYQQQRDTYDKLG